MAKSKITLGYLKKKIAKEGIDALTSEEANALVSFRRLEGQPPTKEKAPSGPKVIPISDDLATEEDRGLGWYRNQLDSIRKLCWDKSIEGLTSTKAQGKWIDFMNMLIGLADTVDIEDRELEVELELDPVATAEVEEAKTNAG